MFWSANGCDLIRWILNGSDPKILQLWFYVAMYWHLLCWSLCLVLWTLATLIFSLQFLHMNVAIKENFPKTPYFLIGPDFFPFFKCHLRNFWIDWMTIFKCHSWILLNNYFFHWSIFLWKYIILYENFFYSLIICPVATHMQILVYYIYIYI